MEKKKFKDSDDVIDELPSDVLRVGVFFLNFALDQCANLPF